MKTLISVVFLSLFMSITIVKSQPEVSAGPLVTLRSIHQKIGFTYQIQKWYPEIWTGINDKGLIFGGSVYRSLIANPNTVDVLAGMSVFNGPPGYPNGWLRIESRMHLTDRDWWAVNVGAGYGLISAEIKYIHRFKRAKE